MERAKYVSEKRKFYRLSKPVTIDVEVITKDGKTIPDREISQGFASDISAGGIFLETPVFEGELLNSLLFKQKLLKITIHLSNDSIKVLGKVVWAEGVERRKTRNHGIGVQFIWITKKQREKIISYINKVKKPE
jgi:c-di-GMP-binding flagellar brake protein YcgR